jgi:probable O-glycosylation ligase (exosortase A-associated)
MRDYILLVIILGSVPICFVSPYFGILMWYWVTYFNPHRFAWSFGYHFPVALVVAVPTLAGLSFARKSLRSLWARECVLLVGLWVWFGITYLYAQGVPLFAAHMEQASYEMTHISKILLMALVMVVVTTSREKLRGVMLVSAGSMGLLAVKGTIFGLRTSGEARVWGPPDSFLADNNAFGLALNMFIPIFFFLARGERKRWIRWLLYFTFLCSVASVILTYSRGGLLGLTVVLLAINLKSRHKVFGAIVIFVVALGLFTFGPGAWMDRMSTTAHGNLDSSANQRLVAWETAWHFAQDYPVTGGTFDTLPDENVFLRYQLRQLPEGFKSTAPHSIYFQLLADHGFVGLGLFLCVIGSCFLSLWKLRRAARALPAAHWLVDYSHMIDVAILGFLTSGAFLSFVYLDVIYQMIAIVAVLKVVFRQEVDAYLNRLEEKESAVVTQERVVSAI